MVIGTCPMSFDSDVVGISALRLARPWRRDALRPPLAPFRFAPADHEPWALAFARRWADNRHPDRPTEERPFASHPSFLTCSSRDGSGEKIESTPQKKTCRDRPTAFRLELRNEIRSAHIQRDPTGDS